MSVTKLGEAFAGAGIHPRDVEFDIAIAKYLNSGGTVVGAFDRLNVAAARMPGMGHVGFARNGLKQRAQTRQPVEDGGAIDLMPHGQSKFAPSSSSNRGGGGLPKCAAEGQTIIAAPVREPTETQRRASADMRKLVRLTILDTHCIRDGRPIGDVRYGEIETLRTANAMEASLFRQIQKKIGYAEHDAKLRDLVTADELNAMKQKAAEVSDAM